MSGEGLVTGDDGAHRCWWCGDDPEYVRYHDEEWGVPVADDRTLFEKLTLEAFQSGLSWLTILRKRPAFRRAFADFSWAEVAEFGEDDVARLLADASIVRHRGKIEATIANARALVALRASGESLADLIWRFEPRPSDRPKRLSLAALKAMTATDSSRAMAKALRARGFRFLGPTTCYALMQAMGLVNDHLEGCHRREPIEARRGAFARPHR